MILLKFTFVSLFPSLFYLQSIGGRNIQITGENPREIRLGYTRFVGWLNFDVTHNKCNVHSPQPISFNRSSHNGK